ncbi:hypothetical protein [Corynebacterium auris]|uniref:hypothetical protein n=1 Tax=Corynebacterium auris TaxID=44750 RepID=UPI0025B5E5C4|nr:hypothetical protein [Corynebacterium auris]WJY68565.1 hypothetical protein CAURIS_08370 [Corynebacterium auris]
MTSRLNRHAAAATVAALTALSLSACGAEDNTSPAADAEIEVSTPTAAPEEDFEVNDANNITTDEISGEKVEDPGMEVSYTWQGTNVANNGGSIVIVAVTNESDVPMPADALGQPTLSYTTDGTNKQEAQPLDAQQSGVDIVGLDLPLGPGATANLKYPFDVPTGNLWDAEFTIGNVTFEGNLNN